MWTQVAEFASVVKGDAKLAGGFNLVGLSQGGLVARAYIEEYSGSGGYPSVFNFVSLCGVQGGEYNCPLELQIIPFLCELVWQNPYGLLFNDTQYFAPADYIVTPLNQTQYLTQNPFLPVINNEIAARANPAYKAAMKGLNAIVLTAALNDTVVYPYQSEQFGGYAWGSNTQVFNFAQSPQYTQDLLGLADMYNSGKLVLNSFVGDHLQWPQSFWDEVVLPYLGTPM
jgi:palmitoyl-protein thioesterase